MKKFLFLLLILLKCASSEAKTIDVYVVHARGYHGLSVLEAKRLIDDVKLYYSNYGITLNVTRFRSIKNPYHKAYNSINNAFDLLITWRNWSNAHHLPKTMRLFITPPISDYILGYSFTVCNPEGLAYVAVQPRNNNGLDRFTHSELAATHEIGHLLGANHDSNLPATLMNPNANAFVTDSILPLSDKSFKEIRKCI